MSKRSPLFYVGDKYKLIDELKQYFPNNIDRYIEPFVGGGSAFMNVEAESYLLNDINCSVIQLHKLLCSYSKKPRAFFAQLFAIINEYGLSCSLLEDIIPYELKVKYPKTYFAEYNREAYLKLRDFYNDSNPRNAKILYLLLIYGFNHMIRFNSSNNFNLPVGNVDFNSNVKEALNNYFTIIANRDVTFFNLDYKKFFDKIELQKGDFIYLDPPYLITFSEYNKLWNSETEEELLNVLDAINSFGIKFAISNVTHYKGRVNDLFIKWANKYSIHNVHSNYISYHDNTVKKFNEVLVTNY